MLSLARAYTLENFHKRKSSKPVKTPIFHPNDGLDSHTGKLPGRKTRRFERPSNACTGQPLVSTPLSLWREGDSRFSPSNIPRDYHPWHGNDEIRAATSRLPRFLETRMRGTVVAYYGAVQQPRGYFGVDPRCQGMHAAGTCPPKLTDYRFIVYLDETRRGVVHAGK